MAFEELIRTIIREELERLLAPLLAQQDAGVARDQQLTVTIAEAGQLLGISRSQAYERARTGELPTVRLGPRSTRVPLAALRLQISQPGSGRPA